MSFPEVRLPTVSGKRDEVMMSAPVSPFQPNCHSAKPNILQTHISIPEMWGTQV